MRKFHFTSPIVTNSTDSKKKKQRVHFANPSKKMRFSAVLCLLLLIVEVFGGEAGCALTSRSCFYRRAGVTFGDAVYDMAESREVSATGDSLNSLCSRENWAHYDNCRADCPLKLEITAPAQHRQSVCLEGSLLDPFVAESHISADHPLLNKEMPLFLPGNGSYDTAQGCNVADYYHGSAVGKMAFLLRGSCLFPQKLLTAKAFGAIATVMMNIAPAPALELQRAEIIGYSNGTEGLPTGMMSQHSGLAILQALIQGVHLTAKYTLNCPAVGAVIETPVASVHDGGCPHPALVGKCLHMKNAVDRLCSTCQMRFFSVSMWGRNNKICLWPSTLLPRKAANLLWEQMTLPAERLPVTYLYGEEVDAGCSLGHYKGVSGRIVFMTFPIACIPVNAVMYAQAQGAKAVIFMTPISESATQPIEGLSQHITIPVHAIQPEHWKRVDNAFKINGKVRKGTAVNMTALDIVISAEVGDVADRVVEDTAAPVVEEAVVEEVPESSGLRFTVGVVLPACAGVVLFCACAWVVRKQVRASSLDSAENDRGIPLGAASTALSLSLLLLVSVVAFTLAFVAGEDAKNSAVLDGEEASAENYQSALANVRLIAAQMRLSVLGQVAAGMNQMLDEGEHMASSVGSIYFDADATWDSLLPKYNLFVKMLMRAPLWRPAVIVDGGFHFASRTRSSLTDPDPAQRNNGSAHGMALMMHDPARGVLYPITVIEDSMVNRGLYHNRLGTEYGDPIAFTEDVPDGAFRWHLSRKTAIQETDVTSIYPQPLSVYTPIYNERREYLGCVQADLQLSSIASVVTNALSVVENATAVVFESDTDYVVSTNAFSENFPYMHYFIGANVRAYQLYKMNEIPAIQLVSLHHALKRRAAGDDFSANINAARFYRAPAHGNEVMNIAVDVNSSVTDASQLEFKAEMRGECTARSCYVPDADGLAMRFYGDNVLNIYKNLTLDTAEVAATRVGPSTAAWRSTLTQYNHSMAVPGTAGVLPSERCVFFPRLAAGMPEKCSLKRPFVEESYTVHIRFRPAHAVAVDDRTQVLFSSSWGGNSLLRIYASGFVTVEVASYGCRTAEPIVPMQGGVWQTLTATTDRLARTCSVYINGVHVSTGRLSDPAGKGLYTGISTTDPYVVGQRFVGDVSAVRAWEMPLEEQEIKGLHASGAKVEMERHVTSREWLVDVRRFVRNSTTSSVLDWRLAVMIPEGDIMRDIHNNNALTRHRLSVRTENLETRLRQRSYETILIVVALVLTSVLVFLMFNDALTKPFSRIAAVMTEAAVMHIDEVPDMSSVLREMNSIHRAMVLMTKNLKVYRAYMPQSVLADTTDDGGGTVVVKASAILSVSSRVSSAIEGSRDRGASSSANLHEVAAAVRNGMALSVSKRRVSFTLINICDWHPKVRELGDSNIIDFHSRTLHLVLACFTAAKGISDVFSGDRFLCAFNGPKALSSHRMAACCAALQVQTQLETELGLRTSSSVVTGEGRVGNLGCDEMKKYSYVMPALSWCHALERYARSLDAGVLCDDWVAQDAVSDFTLRKVGNVRFTKRSQNPILVHVVVARKGSAEDNEWMYQLEAAAQANPYSEWNKFVDFVREGNFQVCQKTSSLSKSSHLFHWKGSPEDN